MTDSQEESLRVVAFGGGTGMPGLLRGLRERSCDLTAVVVVSDDGGSSGELRSLYNMPAPGDLRNVIVALGTADPDLLGLLQFRFDDELLQGHCLGNLALAALTEKYGSFERAVAILCRLAEVRGQVIPATFHKVALVATHEDGSKSTGEVSISSSGKPIESLALKPTPDPASRELTNLIQEADVIVLGPGSLFTSLIPHLLIPGIVEAIEASRAQVVYVANMMTQPGETSGFDLKDHVAALLRHGLPRIDVVHCHDGDLPENLVKLYQAQGAEPVFPCEPGELEGVEIWVDHLLDSGDKLRHSPERLGEKLFERIKSYRQRSSATVSTKIVNENGLHARPASQIVRLANQFQATISIRLRGQNANARSVMDLILLTATCGSELEISATGGDAHEAAEAIASLISNGFAYEARQ